MVLSLLREMRDGAAPARRKGHVIQDLEFAMRAKGGMSQEEETKLRVISFLPRAGFTLAAGLGSYLGWFGLGIGNKLVGLPPPHGLQRFGFSAGCAYIMGKILYYSTVRACATMILKSEDDERMKMELANIILTKYSDDEPLVEVVKRHFFAEHLFDDLHQDKPLFRWHPRRSYIDSAFVERVKEIEASNSHDEPGSVSTQATLNVRSFGDLTEDPFACILGSSGGGMESNSPPGKTGTVLKRSELRARRKSHRHHNHRHGDKFAAL